VRILLSADPLIPVPPVTYGGIERIVDALVREYRKAGHAVGLMAHAESTANADQRFAWPVPSIAGAIATARNALALRRAAGAFQADVIHSFSRLAYLLPLLPTRPAVMSYQRHTGGRQLALAARLGGRRLRFTGCSDHIRLMGQGSGGRWNTVPNFIEPERLPFVKEVPSDAPLVFLSRLDDIKGPDLAIAIARASGRRLILAGNRAEEGPQRDFFDSRVQPWLGKDGVEWIGEVDDIRKAALLGSAAALLVPIRWDEPFGIVFAESLACGTPVITCARGALPEIIEDGAAAVARLGSLDRSVCRATALTRYSAAVVAPRYLELLQELVG
jgi:glycosyltransferase involved in cell wall biosynthesis